MFFYIGIETWTEKKFSIFSDSQKCPFGMLILAYWLQWYICLWQLVKIDLCVNCFKNAIWICRLDFVFGLSPSDQCTAEQSLSKAQASKAIERHSEKTGNYSSDSVHNSDAMTFSCITDQKWPTVLWICPNMLSIVRKQPETLPSEVMVIVACEERIPPASLVWEENQEWIWTTAVHCERFCLVKGQLRA